MMLEMIPRMYYLNAPQASRLDIYVGIGMLGVGILLVNIMFILQRPSGATTLLSTVFLGIGGVLLWVGLAARQRAQHRPDDRLRRLESFLAHPEAAKRFPHRALERFLRVRPIFGFESKLEKHLKACPPGTIILVNRPAPIHLPPPAPHTIPFEPVEIDDGPQRREILRMGYGTAIPEALQAEAVQTGEDTGGKKPMGGRVHFWRVIRILIRCVLLIWILTLGYYFYQGIQQREWGDIAGMGVGLVILLVLLILSWMYPTNEYLIPRAILRHRRPLLGQTNSGILYRLQDCVWFYRAGELRVADDDDFVSTFSMTPTKFHALLCALFNQAPTPTDDELETFLEGTLLNRQERNRQD